MWIRDRMFTLDYKKRIKDLSLGKINSKGMSKGGAGEKPKQISVTLIMGN